METKTRMITLRTRLMGGIYQSSRDEWEESDISLPLSEKNLSFLIDSMRYRKLQTAGSYGSIGMGSTWIELDGEEIDLGYGYDHIMVDGNYMENIPESSNDEIDDDEIRKLIGYIWDGNNNIPFFPENSWKFIEPYEAEKKHILIYDIFSEINDAEPTRKLPLSEKNLGFAEDYNEINSPEKVFVCGNRYYDVDDDYDMNIPETSDDEVDDEDIIDMISDDEFPKNSYEYLDDKYIEITDHYSITLDGEGVPDDCKVADGWDEILLGENSDVTLSDTENAEYILEIFPQVEIVDTWEEFGQIIICFPKEIKSNIMDILNKDIGFGILIYWKNEVDDENKEGTNKYLEDFKDKAEVVCILDEDDEWRKMLFVTENFQDIDTPPDGIFDYDDDVELSTIIRDKTVAELYKNYMDNQK